MAPAGGTDANGMLEMLLYVVEMDVEDEPDEEKEKEEEKNFGLDIEELLDEKKEEEEKKTKKTLARQIARY